MIVWRHNCPECYAGPGEACCSMSARNSRTKMRSDAKHEDAPLKRPHASRVLAGECPKCGYGPGAACRAIQITWGGSPLVTRRPLDKPHRERVRACCKDVEVRCYRAPMARLTACGLTGGADSETWSDVQCPACLEKQTAQAISYARYCGTEYEANLDNSKVSDYLDDCAAQFGASSWRELSAEKKHIAKDAFDKGRRAERDS